MARAKSYILEVTGGTDSTGSAALQLRPEPIVARMRWCSTWLRSMALQPHRFYLIGIGKDKEVAPNTTAEGRKQNRRVEVQLLAT